MRDEAEILERYNILSKSGCDILDANGSYIDLANIIHEMKVLNWVLGHEE